MINVCAFYLHFNIANRCCRNTINACGDFVIKKTSKEQY